MSFRNITDAQMVQQFFRRYYEKDYTNPFIPFDFEKRELGYTPFGQKIMVRHLSFRNHAELHKTLVKEAPLHVYRSAAIYNYPQAPMEEKGWLGAELIFDIDADHLQTSCKEKHDYLICASCGRKLVEKSAKCPYCGGETVDVRMTCEICLDKTKTEMMRLIEFMEKDFGLENLIISFSGNRGYHLSVPSRDVLELGRAERQEIVDYVTGSRMDLRIHGILTKNGFFPDSAEPGWRGKIAEETKKILASLANHENQVYRRLENTVGSRRLKELQKIASQWSDKPRWEMLSIGKKSVLESIVFLAVENSSSHVDTVVTTDIHRLLRLADTLNGKTGLKAAVVKVDEFQDFNPLQKAVVIPEEPQLKVRVVHSPHFVLGEELFGPYKNEVVTLPAFAAVYLLCKGLATLVNA